MYVSCTFFSTTNTFAVILLYVLYSMKTTLEAALCNEVYNFFAFHDFSVYYWRCPWKCRSSLLWV